MPFLDSSVICRACALALQAVDSVHWTFVPCGEDAFHYALVNNTKRKVFISFERWKCALCPSRLLWLFKCQMITAVLNNSFFLFLNLKSSRSFDSASQNIHTSLTRWVADWKSCSDIGYQQISMLLDHQYTLHCLFSLLIKQSICFCLKGHAWLRIIMLDFFSW